ncbi:MAG TPA: HAMP domain-containing sensor histidine kinase, partial [Candidatus Didemnitutus sp.]|nr:HAMP domain-containing sensor histidine kinase [Candidatus Didemnitutus sp.]
GLHAEFYRFLSQNGAVLPPGNVRQAGELAPHDEALLALPAAPTQQQIGYLLRQTSAGPELIEIITVPIQSTETGDVIAALALGFKPTDPAGSQPGAGITRGIWFDGHLHLMPGVGEAGAELAAQVARAVAAPAGEHRSVSVTIAGVPHLLFHQQLNAGSHYAPAYEVCVYPLTEWLARRRQLRWQALGVGGLLLLAGLGLSHVLAGRLSVPVEKLAVDSEENLARRERAEAALETTNEELQRAARFSADASHQLMTPVTVLRAGLEELLAREHLTARETDEISSLIHQTYRLSTVIKDLLLLSRLDAGRLRIDFSAVDLTQLIAAAVDDLSALPEALDLAVETDVPPGLRVSGEKNYLALVLQNLLENAHKYNRPGGTIRVTAREDDSTVVVTIANTGNAIPPAAQAHIFERFHRGVVGENVRGYGLGLNLAHELVRLHRGELRLARSDGDWTEFELRLRAAAVAAVDRQSA